MDRYSGAEWPSHLQVRISGGKSIVFFYLNYDNPFSADEYHYDLVGCARLKEIGNIHLA